MLNKFKELVDSTDATIGTKEDFMKYYHVDSIEVGSFVKVLGDKIENLNYPSGKIDRSTFNKLNEELVYRELIFNENSITYLQIIKTFFDANPKMERLPSFEDKKWIDVIEFSKNYLNFYKGERLSRENLKRHFQKEYDRSQSINYLRNNGCKINIKNNKINFISGLEEILLELDYKIEKLGGINLIWIMLSIIEYDNEFQRFFFLKNTSILEQNKELEVPWGYLFNLALKHPNFKNHSKKNKEKSLFDEIMDLAKILVNGVCNVQEYNIFNHIFQNDKTLPQHASDLVLYDSLFRIPQSNIELELKLCKCFFSFEDNFFEETLGFSLDDFINVITYLVSSARNISKFILLNLSKKLDCSLSYDVLHKILNFMSHNHPINEDYLFPNDYLKIDFFKKPFIKVNQNQFFIPTISISSPNFYEVLADNLREPYNQKFNNSFNDMIGNKLEDFVKSLFDEYGINYISNSKYYDEEYEGETDFIIESDDSIIIIEVKKKVLSRESKSGFNYRIIMDLLGGFVKSQFQASKLEYLLKKYNEVNLELNDKSKYKLLLNGRKVKRISLTQLDYGSLFDSYFLENFLRTLINNDFILKDGDDKLNKEFENYKKDALNYKKIFSKLNEIEDINFMTYVHVNTYFMCLSQLFEVIKRSYDNNSFNENLPNYLVEYGSFDWFFEYKKFIHTKPNH